MFVLLGFRVFFFCSMSQKLFPYASTKFSKSNRKPMNIKTLSYQNPVMYLIPEEINFALVSWGAGVGLYQHLGLTILGVCCLSFVPALMQMTGTHFLLEYQCKMRQACSMLSTRRRFTAVFRTSQAYI